MDTLEAQLYSEDPATADRAALVLLSSEMEESFRILRTALSRSNSVTTRAAVIKAFITQQDNRIRAEMTAALGDKSETIVELAKTHLWKIVGPDVAGDLLVIARDASRGTKERVAALTVLAEVGSAGSVEGTLDLLDDNDPQVVAAAVTALQRITYQPFADDAETWRDWYRQNRKLTREQWQKVGSRYFTQTEELKSQIAALQTAVGAGEKEMAGVYARLVDLGVELQRWDIVIDVLDTGRPIEAQIYAAEALGRSGKVPKAVAKLIEKAKSPDARLAKAAIEALGVNQDPSAMDVVVSRLSSGDAALKLAAVKAYAALPQSDLELLLPLVGDTSADVRATVAKAFGSRKWGKGLPALLGMLDDEKLPEVRAAVAEALGQIGDKSAVSWLIKLVTEPDDKVRFAAVRGLDALADPASFDTLLEATRDPVSSSVREAAVVALVKIGDKRAVDRFLEMVRSDPHPKVADQAWQAIMMLVGEDADLILSLSQRLQEAGRFSKAEVLLKLLADRTVESPAVLDARRRLAKAYLDTKDFQNYQAAKVYYQRILDSHPSDAEALKGITTALLNMEDMQGLAALYARRIVTGSGNGEVRKEFLLALQKLLDEKNYAAVAPLTQQVLAASTSLDAEFAAAVKGIEGKALPAHLAELVALIGDEDTAKSLAARNALAGYGAAASKALVGGLASPIEAVRTESLRLLTAISGGKTFDFDPKRPAAEQEASLEQWRQWLSAGTQGN